jgi:hypothetical protein
MKNKIIALILVLFTGALRTDAQTAGAPTTLADSIKTATPEQRAKMLTGKMKEKLALTDDQYKKVSDLNLTYAKKMDPIIHSDDSRLTKYRQSKSLLDEKDQKLKSILTSDQFKQYEAIKKEMMDKMRGNMR